MLKGPKVNQSTGGTETFTIRESDLTETGKEGTPKVEQDSRSRLRSRRGSDERTEEFRQLMMGVQT